MNGFNKMLAGSGGGGSSATRRARQSAFDKFREMGFPTTRNEDWKYTNIARFLKDEYGLAGEFPSGTRVNGRSALMGSLAGLIDGNERVYIGQEVRLMLFAVGRSGAPAQVSHRARQDLQIVREERRKEGHFELDPRGLKCVARM